MRLLIISVLAVAMIGLMVPSASGLTYDKGEIIDNNENLSINKIKIHSKNTKDLLELHITMIPYSHGIIQLSHFDLFMANSLSDTFRLNNPIYTGEDYTSSYGVVKANNEWFVNCPNSYWGQSVRADIPDDYILCYEISKNTNHFELFGVKFSRAAAETDFISSITTPSSSPLFQPGLESKSEVPAELAEKSITEKTIERDAKSSEGGGCLIATAAFGSEMAPQVQFLREIRDGTVMSTQSGTTFMTGFNQFYYSFSPYVADYERENPVFKEAVKVTLTPLLTSLTLLNYVEVDTEEEMLGYGIGIILLNIGMYFVLPAVLIISLKKRFL